MSKRVEYLEGALRCARRQANAAASYAAMTNTPSAIQAMRRANDHANRLALKLAEARAEEDAGKAAPA